MKAHKTLVAGIGNIFNSDDGFGVEVAQLLISRPPVDGVRIEDYGIRGVHLALELLEGYDLLILVDAIASGEPPGTLVVVDALAEKEDTAGAEATEPLDAHRMDPQAVIAMVMEMGGMIGRVLVVGCQPADLSEGIGLSPVVVAAVEPAARMIEELLAEREVAWSVV